MTVLTSDDVYSIPLDRNQFLKLVKLVKEYDKIDLEKKYRSLTCFNCPKMPPVMESKSKFGKKRYRIFCDEKCVAEFFNKYQDLLLEVITG
jgi:RNase P subunit RPR2